MFEKNIFLICKKIEMLATQKYPAANNPAGYF